jgi:hypothetical protein
VHHGFELNAASAATFENFFALRIVVVAECRNRGRVCVCVCVRERENSKQRAAPAQSYRLGHEQPTVETSSVGAALTEESARNARSKRRKRFIVLLR